MAWFLATLMLLVLGVYGPEILGRIRTPSPDELRLLEVRRLLYESGGVGRPIAPLWFSSQLLRMPGAVERVEILIATGETER